MTDVVFREAVEGDVAALVAMLADDMLGRSREVVSDPPAPTYLEAFRRVKADPYDMLIVAERDGRVIGCAQLTLLKGLSRQGALRGQIESVRVAAEARGEKVGEALIRDLVERARKAGCSLVQLTSDVRRERAHAFYERLGFTATHVGMKLEF